uniref:Uncharacterized protein n=1 Tax=Anguilla anguilla TaxID=7936 RepID=A0A0E9QND6_ANGAN
MGFDCNVKKLQILAELHILLQMPVISLCVWKLFCGSHAVHFHYRNFMTCHQGELG